MMSNKNGYIFRNFEGAAEPVLRDFPVSEGAVGSTAGPVAGHPRLPERLERAELVRLLHESGAAHLFDGRFAAQNVDAVSHCIVNAVHNGPLDQAWTPEMFGDPGLITLIPRILKAMFPGADIIFAINRRNRKAFESFDFDGCAEIRVMSDRYPQELPELLIRDIAGGRSDSAVTASFEDALCAGECLVRGETCGGRILLVAGPGVSRPGWRRIPAGTRFGDIRRRLLKSEEYGPWRIIRGNLFTGTSIASDDETVSWSDREITVIREYAVRDFHRFLNPGFDYDSYSRVTVSSFIPLLKRRLDSNVHGGVRPCVQCNFCDEVCPVGLYPHLIWKRVNAGMLEESLRFRPERCIGCGLCDYVCPSKIDVAAAVRVAGSACREGRGV